MLTSDKNRNIPAIKFEYLNWVASEPLPYDQVQSTRLHEPGHRTITTDPITGHDLTKMKNPPSLVDGNLTVYFESEASRTEYQNVPLNHPNLKLPYPAAESDDRGG